MTNGSPSLRPSSASGRRRLGAASHREDPRCARDPPDHQGGRAAARTARGHLPLDPHALVARLLRMGHRRVRGDERALRLRVLAVAGLGGERVQLRRLLLLQRGDVRDDRLRRDGTADGAWAMPWSPSRRSPASSRPRRSPASPSRGSRVRPRRSSSRRRWSSRCATASRTCSSAWRTGAATRSSRHSST